MGLIQLRTFLRRHERLAIDTCLFIYQLEDNARYSALAGEVFDWLSVSAHVAVTSTVTMAELLVVPYQTLDERRVATFFDLLTKYPNLEWVAPDLEIADKAARIRAAHRLHIPEALLAATAIQSQMSGLITNDAIFERVKGFETLVLKNLL